MPEESKKLPDVYQLNLTLEEARVLNIGWGVVCALIIGAEPVAKLMLREILRKPESRDRAESLTKKLMVLMEARFSDKLQDLGFIKFNDDKKDKPDET